MDQTTSFLYSVYQIFWGEGYYQWAFYLMCIFILILEKRKIEKRIFAIYPLCFIALMFTPVAVFITRKLSDRDGYAYFARLYSMIPLPQILAMGVVLFIAKLSSLRLGVSGCVEGKNEETSKKGNIQKLIKLHLVIIACVAMCLLGTSYYEQYWMQPAENLSKFSESVYWIINSLPRNEEICIALPDYLAKHVRQADASIYMPYGRELNSLGQALSQANPDPLFVMQEAGKQKCNYIAIYANEENRTSFLQQGWSPFAESEEYFIYKVENVPRVKSVHDNNHRVILEMNCDASGDPIPTEEGYTSIAYGYDKYGHQITETYLDQNGNPIQLSGGYAEVNTDYISPFTSLISCTRYLNNDGSTSCVEGRYETRYEYDGKGRMISESYYDEDGEPMNRIDQEYASKRVVYNENNKVTAEYYYNTSNELKMTSFGYAYYTRQYNEKGEVSGEKYYDESGSLIGEVTESTKGKAKNIIMCSHFSDGVQLHDDTYKMSTIIPNNHFYIIQFQIWNSKGEYLLDFGNNWMEGFAKGEYIHELPDGLYWLRLKVNTNLGDESIKFLVHLMNGDHIVYQYDLIDLSEKLVIIQNLSLCIE